MMFFHYLGLFNNSLRLLISKVYKMGIMLMGVTLREILKEGIQIEKH